MFDRPIERVLERSREVRPQRERQWTALCPAHDDRSPSLSIGEDDNGAVGLHCHAGCDTSAVVAALGLQMRDLFPPKSKPPKATRPPKSPPITLKHLAAAKGLPAPWLANALGWHDLPRGGVGLPYRSSDGKVLFVKRRVALKAKDGSFYPEGITLAPCGLDHLQVARGAGYLVLVEGETDLATLLYHNLPALGLPGAGTAKVLQAEYLTDIGTLYVWQEPDEGGAKFIRGVGKRLRELGYNGDVKVVRAAGVKDVSDLYLRNSEGFEAAFQAALDSAEPLPSPPEGDEEDAKPLQDPPHPYGTGAPGEHRLLYISPNKAVAPQVISDFSAKIMEEITAEDGARSFGIVGTTTNGRPFTCEIAAAAFADDRRLKAAL
jgi:hypothetical protein